MSRFSRLELRPPIEEDLVSAAIPGGVQGAGQRLHGGDQDAECLWEQVEGRMEFDFHDRLWVNAGI
ncbi:MAG: hypothetical protein WAW52_11465 [Methanothrix sp.]